MYICQSQSPNSSHHHPPPLSPLGVHTFVLYICVSIPALQTGSSVPFFHIYVLIYDVCFSLSDLLHSVWHSLDPSTSLQMTQFRSFLWLSNIPSYVYMYLIYHTVLFIYTYNKAGNLLKWGRRKCPLTCPADFWCFQQRQKAEDRNPHLLLLLLLSKHLATENFIA